MSRAWTAFRCRVLRSHRWMQLREDEETYFECRDCRRRVFGHELPERDLRYLGSGG